MSAWLHFNSKSSLQCTSTDSPPRSNSNKKDRRRSSSQPRSSVRTGSEPALPAYPYPPQLYSTFPPSDLNQVPDQRHLPYPPLPPIQDPHAQYNLAHAVNYLTYVLTQGVPAGFPPSHPSHAYRQPPANWPQTPQHRSRGRTRGRSSSPSQPSSPILPFAYATPGHGYSSATSPPASSSPIPSSPTWPVHHASTNEHAHSKSRGRRVSFKFDSEDERPPQVRGEGKKASRIDKKTSGSAAQQVPSSQRTPKPPLPSVRRRISDSSSDEESDMRQHHGERGRTPGPSSRHSRSQSAKH